MAYDEGLAERLREILASEPDITERRMFGGLAFMAGGNMCCGIIGNDLMVRVGKDANDDALARPHTREMDFTGRAMTGYVYVAPEGVVEDDDLASWLQRGLSYARTLPAK